MGKSAEKDKHKKTKEFITRWCTRLAVDQVDWDKASVPSSRYNCMGYAVGILKWWQPPDVRDGVVMNPKDYWPPGVPADDTLGSYVKAAESAGFSICDGAQWEEGFQKITLYHTEGEEKLFKHAARHVAADIWDSKLGPESDFEHSPTALDDLIFYGTGRVYMKRPMTHDSRTEIAAAAIDR